MNQIRRGRVNTFLQLTGASICALSALGAVGCQSVSKPLEPKHILTVGHVPIDCMCIFPKDITAVRWSHHIEFKMVIPGELIRGQLYHVGTRLRVKMWLTNHSEDAASDLRGGCFAHSPVAREFGPSGHLTWQWIPTPDTCFNSDQTATLGPGQTWFRSTTIPLTKAGWVSIHGFVTRDFSRPVHGPSIRIHVLHRL